jgi:hypothetical protein
MKTKLITLSVLLLSAFALKAQENYINYNLYNPDTCFSFQSSADTLKFDLDQDGTYDIYFDAYYQSGAGLLVTINTPSPDWQWSWTYANAFVPLTDTTMIDETLRWQYGYWELAMYPEFTHFAFRHQTVDGYHYGWAHIYLTRATRAWHTVCVSGMGYCTLPDQSIQWGQIEYFGINESYVSNAFATVHPNPTTGLVTIAGENLRQAEVLNMLGQQVLSVQGEGNELRIDMATLPAGVYFVNVTDEEGRKCVRKVVKE